MLCGAHRDSLLGMRSSPSLGGPPFATQRSLQMEGISTASTSHLDPLPAELAKLVSLSSRASSTGLDAISALISQLEAAREKLTQAQNPAQDLGLLRTVLATDCVKVEKQQKEWGTALSKFGKTVDKVSQAHPHTRAGLRLQSPARLQPAQTVIRVLTQTSACELRNSPLRWRQYSPLRPRTRPLPQPNLLSSQSQQTQLPSQHNLNSPNHSMLDHSPAGKLSLR